MDVRGDEPVGSWPSPSTNDVPRRRDEGRRLGADINSPPPGLVSLAQNSLLVGASSNAGDASSVSSAMNGRQIGGGRPDHLADQPTATQDECRKLHTALNTAPRNGPRSGQRNQVRFSRRIRAPRVTPTLRAVCHAFPRCRFAGQYRSRLGTGRQSRVCSESLVKSRNPDCPRDKISPVINCVA